MTTPLQGKCKCFSNNQVGYFYGQYCEMENECELDQHCGEGGVCRDTQVIKTPTPEAVNNGDTDDGDI